MKTKEHSSTPWNVGRPYGEPGIYIAASNTDLVAKIYEHTGEANANAEIIARAVNCHADLVEALTLILADLPIVECQSFHHAKRDRHSHGQHVFVRSLIHVFNR